MTDPEVYLAAVVAVKRAENMLTEAFGTAGWKEVLIHADEHGLREHTLGAIVLNLNIC
jgi:hypothetical protein